MFFIPLVLGIVATERGGGYKYKMKNNKLPKFKSYQEEAHFWDTHDATDYFDRERTITLNFSKAKSRKESILNVRLQPELKSKLYAVAQDMGTQPSTLARMWLVERLKTLHLA